jgi:hypothetical protein
MFVFIELRALKSIRNTLMQPTDLDGFWPKRESELFVAEARWDLWPNYQTVHWLQVAK